jgi:hypothetical protein
MSEDIANEVSVRKKHRFIWLFLLCTLPFLLIAIVQDRVFPLQVYVLSAWNFGYIFYVDEFLSLKKSWFLMAMLPMVLLHCVILGFVYLGDKEFHNPNPLLVMGTLFIVVLAEYWASTVLIELCRPKTAKR